MPGLKTSDYLAQKFRALRRLTGNTQLLGVHYRDCAFCKNIE